MAFAITSNAETFEFYNRSRDEIRLYQESGDGVVGVLKSLFIVKTVWRLMLIACLNWMSHSSQTYS